MGARRALLQCLLSLFLIIEVAVATANFFKPFNVSYDHRALIIDGERRMLISAGIHYPRATPEVIQLPPTSLIVSNFITIHALFSFSLSFLLH
jgi:hypothetical protein